MILLFLGMDELNDFLKDNFEKNSYTISFCETFVDDFMTADLIKFHKNSKQYEIYYFEHMGRMTDVIRWGQIAPELEAEFLIIKETLSSNGYDLETYGAFKNKDLGMILRFRMDSYIFDLKLYNVKAK